ncbi:MAG: hypothetical protein ABI999_12120 [Acidobacteriota bacterium]
MRAEASMGAHETVPFVGLAPFSEANAEYFFGRTNDKINVATNLRAAPLTVLYGASGVGKSSLLNAGVVPYLHDISTASIIPGEPPEFLPIVFRDWANDPKDGLNLHIATAVSAALDAKLFPTNNNRTNPQCELLADAERPWRLTGEEIGAVRDKNADGLDLFTMLKNWTDLIRTSLFIILDQFEDFFLHPTFAAGPGSFGDAFPGVVNNSDLPVNFMLTIRDDALAKLDFFKGRIPDMTKNTLRLHQLDREATEEAIRNPVATYNKIFGGNFTIEDTLVEKLLEDLQVDKVKFDSQGQADLELNKPNAAGIVKNYKVEAPYLQIVMLRLWENEVTQNTKCLSLDTLVNEKELGGVKNIVSTHLDKVIDELSPTEQDLLAEFIHFTVTRAGAKIPSSAAGLAEWADDVTKKDDIERILIKMSTGQNRIFRTVDNLADPQNVYYEVMHDALAPAILSWRSRFLERDRIEKLNKASSTLTLLKKLAIRVGIPLILFFAGVIAMAGFIAYSSHRTAGTATNTLANKEVELDKTTGELQNKSSALTAQQQRDQQTADLLHIFDDLSTKGNKQESIAQLDDLVTKGGLPDDLKRSFLALAPNIVKGPELADVQRILRQTQGVSIPRVFIQFLEPQQQTARDDVIALLKGAKLTVPKVQQIPNINLSKTQVRYFYDTDRDLATTVAKLLSDARIPNVKPVLVSGYENQKIPQQQIEVWFANDAMSSPATVDAGNGACPLRKTPDARSDAFLTILNGTTVQVQICRTDQVSGKGPNGRDVKGQWCRVQYGDDNGWVFDAWLDPGTSKS